MAIPKKVKYRKVHRGTRKGKACTRINVDFGEYGLRAMESAWITEKQIESARIAMTHHIKRIGKIWIRIFTDKPVSKKPLEVRMGKGKGGPEFWVSVVKRGTIMFEIGGADEDLCKEALVKASFKLPIKTKIVSRKGLKTKI
ncbi:MAG: 50S ribosomal protein L16 [bacterium]